MYNDVDFVEMHGMAALEGMLRWDFHQNPTTDRKWLLDNIDKIVEDAKAREDSQHMYLWARALAAGRETASIRIVG